MSYLIHADISESVQVRRRIVACAAEEGVPDPSDWAARHAWTLVKSDWVAAVESALANGDYDGDPYTDEAVITDAMILAAVARAGAAGAGGPGGTAVDDA
jgi:hypothetical protein